MDSAETEPGSSRVIRVPAIAARRALFASLVVGTSLAGVAIMFDIMASEGFSMLEGLILGLFGATFAWIALAFWTAVLGFLLVLLRRDPLTLGPPRKRGGPGRVSLRTALVMPVYNEEVQEVLAGLHETLLSLEVTGQADRFDVFLLSDTDQAARAQEEEAGWSQLVASHEWPGAMEYRRRPLNVGRKAGNIAEFLDRRGADYDCLVVLDADSVMEGATLVELALTMEANPRVGILQTVPVPHRETTVFGRLVQFAATVYSPMFAAGQCFWQGTAANYWGHNAIIRVGPFMKHAKLPVLAGRPPLGGEVLSHDFVEAALMRRAGWEVAVLPLLGGSFEGVPSNILDFAKRDRRWCQGSLQHLRLLFLGGLHPLSRIHFVSGAMGYVASLLWLVMLGASSAYVLAPGFTGPVMDVGRAAPGLAEVMPLLIVTVLMLVLPKALGLMACLWSDSPGEKGRLRFIVGGGVELGFSVLVAPLMMLFHSSFVVSILAGRSVSWDTQVREGRLVRWSEAVRRSAGALILGVVWGGITLATSPAFFLWLSPLFLGLLAAPFLVRWTSAEGFSRAAPSERWFPTRPIAIPADPEPVTASRKARLTRIS